METINRELRTLSHEDFRRLTEAMLAYRLDKGGGYVVKSYGDGLMMVKDSTHGQGRCLFFSVRIERGEEILTALLVYKKGKPRGSAEGPRNRPPQNARDVMNIPPRTRLP